MGAQLSSGVPLHPRETGSDYNREVKAVGLPGSTCPWDRQSGHILEREAGSLLTPKIKTGKSLALECIPDTTQEQELAGEKGLGRCQQ
jgi:hypothetical protein